MMVVGWLGRNAGSSLRALIQIYRIEVYGWSQDGGGVSIFYKHLQKILMLTESGNAWFRLAPLFCSEESRPRESFVGQVHSVY